MIIDAKIYRTILSVLLIAFLILGFCLFKYFHKGQNVELATVNISIGQDTLIAEIASNSPERELGLGNRPSLAENHGMLFFFDHSDYYGFWMKDTLIPLDMIWIDQNKKVVDIKNDVLPSTYPAVFLPRAPSLYVLEVNAGYAKTHEIKIGQSFDF